MRCDSRAGLVIVALLFGSVPAAAQAGADRPAVVGPANPALPTRSGPIDLSVTIPKKTRCGAANAQGEIVVCGADHGEDVRVPSTADSDPDSREALDNGIPQAPNVSGLPDCRRKCIGMGAAPPHVYVIDVRAIPEAPEDSDAQKVANGEISDR